MRYRAYRGKLQKMQMIGRWRETKSTGSKSSVYPSLQPVELEATRGDPVLSRVLHFVLHGWPAEENTPEELRYYCAKREEFTVEDGCLLRGNRVLIPSKYQQVLSELHLNHPGMVRMKSLARLQVWWPNLDSDIEQTVRDCSDCQANRCKTPLKVNNPWIWPTRPWQRLHVDFSGPFNGGC